MKKFRFTFGVLLAFLAVINLLLFFMPAFQSHNNLHENVQFINLFQAAFGTTVKNVIEVQTGVCGGLLLAVIFMGVGILLCLLSIKSKFFSFLAGGFFIAAGVLIFNGETLIKYSWLNNTLSTGFVEVKFYYGYAITTGVVAVVLGSFGIINGITGLVKPKAQEAY